MDIYKMAVTFEKIYFICNRFGIQLLRNISQKLAKLIKRVEMDVCDDNREYIFGKNNVQEYLNKTRSKTSSDKYFIVQ